VQRFWRRYRLGGSDHESASAEANGRAAFSKGKEAKRPLSSQSDRDKWIKVFCFFFYKKKSLSWAAVNAEAFTRQRR
jgi:hypothetical protein